MDTRDRQVVEHYIACLKTPEQNAVFPKRAGRLRRVGEDDSELSGNLAHRLTNIKIDDLHDVDHHQHEHDRCKKHVRREPEFQKRMQIQKGVDPAKGRRVLDRVHQLRVFRTAQTLGFGIEFATRVGEHLVEIFASKVLSQQIPNAQKPTTQFHLDESFQFGCVCLFGGGQKAVAKLGAACLEVLDEQRLALDPRHQTRHEHVTECAKKSRQDDKIE